MMSTVVLNLSGLMNGLLHLFLRSNLSSSSFGPKEGRHWSREKHEIRLWGPNELAFTNYLTNPVSGPQSPQSPSSKFRSESRTSLVKVEKFGMASPPFRSPGKTPPFPLTPVKAAVPAVPEPTKESPRRSKYHLRKPSYSLFPADGIKSSDRANDNVDNQYDMSDLQPPPRILGKGHIRNSSVVSSATVQIGLRLSHAPGTEPPPSLSAPTASKNLGVPSTGSFLLPIAFGAPAPKAEPTLSSNTYTAPTSSSANDFTLSPYKFVPPSPKPIAPLQISKSTTSIARPLIPEPLQSPRRPIPSPLITPVILSGSVANEANGFASQFNKDLPPTPGPQLNPLVAALASRESTTQLTPAVYSPSNASEKKLEHPVVQGLPNGPKCPKSPSLAGLLSPSPNGAPSPRTPLSKPGVKPSWI